MLKGEPHAKAFAFFLVIPGKMKVLSLNEDPSHCSACHPDIAMVVQNPHYLFYGTISNTKVLLRDGINTAVGGPADLDVERYPEKVFDFL